jgi:type II secretory pathway pseudopilin PulG
MRSHEVAGCRAGRSARERGASLLEVVIAVALIALLVLPTARIVIATGQSSNQARLRAEAADQATDAIESVQNEAAFGAIDTTKFPFSTKANPSWPVTLSQNGNPPAGIAKTTDTFHVAGSFVIEDAGGGSVCSSIGAGPSTPQIYDISVSVGWTGDGNDPVVETTFIAPEQGGNIPVNAGELAVPVETYLGAAETTTSVDVTIVGTKTGNPTIVETQPSGKGSTGGCAVFDNLDPSYSWEVYLGEGSLQSGSPVITPPTDAVAGHDEEAGLINGNPTYADFSESAPALVVGSTVAAAPIVVGAPVNLGVAFQTWQCPAGVCTPVPTVQIPTGLAVTVAAEELSGSSVCGGTSTEPTFSFDPGSATISTVGLYPYPDYTLWAGDTSDSCPSFQVGTPATPAYPILPPNVPLVLGSATSATLDVFDTALTTGAVAPPPSLQLTATHVQPPATDPPITLSAFGAGNLSTTGLPLGEYTLGTTLAGHTVSPQTIWVTPTAVWYGSGAPSQPSALGKSSPSGTPITVTITP